MKCVFLSTITSVFSSFLPVFRSRYSCIYQVHLHMECSHSNYASLLQECNVCIKYEKQQLQKPLRTQQAEERSRSTQPAMQARPVKNERSSHHLHPTSPPPSNNFLSLSFLFANRLFNAPSHLARFSSSGAQKRKLLSSAMICIQYALFLDMGSISTALMIDDSGMRRIAEYS